MDKNKKSPIYTRLGDKGTTSTIYEKDISKGDFFLSVIGTLDEINSTLGIVKSYLKENEKDYKLILKLQNYLFDLGGELVTYKINHNWEWRIKFMEEAINQIDANNAPLHYFILPGGSIEASFIHQARAICRRGERLFWKWFEKIKETNKLKKENIQSLLYAGKFLNRLSDLLFVLARHYNNNGNDCIPWDKNLK